MRSKRRQGEDEVCSIVWGVMMAWTRAIWVEEARLRGASGVRYRRGIFVEKGRERVGRLESSELLLSERRAVRGKWSIQVVVGI